MARNAAASSSTLKRLLTKGLMSTTSITHPPPHIPSSLLRSLPLAPTSIRCFGKSSSDDCDTDGNTGDSEHTHSRYDMVSTYGSWGKTQLARIFPGTDYNHWFIIMVNPCGENATKEELIDCYIRTLAKVIGSEEKAKEKIYKVICDPHYDLGFGCEVDWETAYELQDLPEVACIVADFYRDPNYKDYGGELFVNGEIVQRSPDRERRVKAFPRPRLDNIARNI